MSQDEGLYRLKDEMTDWSIVYWYDEGTSFMTFVWRSLYPKGNNASKYERSLIINFCVALFLIHSIWEQVPNIGAHL
jgi:hypothetical protein